MNERKEIFGVFPSVACNGLSEASSVAFSSGLNTPILFNAKKHTTMKANNKINAINNGKEDEQMSFNALNKFFSSVMSPYDLAKELQRTHDSYSLAVSDTEDMASDFSQNIYHLKQMIGLLIVTQQENDPSELPSLADYVSDVYCLG